MLMPVSVNLFAASGGILYALGHATVEGKVIICLLVLGSIFSWSVMITKFVLVRRARRSTALFLKKFRNSRRPLTLFMSRETYASSPSYWVYMAGCRELVFQMLGSTEVDESLAVNISDADKISSVAMSAVRSAMEREVGEQALMLEDRMILLATAVSGAPFLGLLGTVWGVMDTFAGVAAANSASLASMAPGVSAALITTVTGLLVAIPAMFGYNFLVVTVRGLTVELDNFAAELAAAFEHRYLKGS
jgi:biopolymer transport protein TolQ